MGKVKQWAYDMAEQTIDDAIESIIKNEKELYNGRNNCIIY